MLRVKLPYTQLSQRDEENKTVDTKKNKKAETTIRYFVSEVGVILEKEQCRISLEKKTTVYIMTLDAEKHIISLPTTIGHSFRMSKSP